MLGSSWGHDGIILGSCWGHIGFIFGSFWGHDGIILGSFWGHVGILLGPYWGHVGVILASCWYQRISPKCCGADFGSRIKISGNLLGQNDQNFDIYPFDWSQVASWGLAAEGEALGVSALAARNPNVNHCMNLNSCGVPQINLSAGGEKP